MGLFSSIGKALKKTFGGTVGLALGSLSKPLGKALGKMFGAGQLEDLGAQQAEMLRRQGEANKLDTMNQMNNVTQFEDDSTGLTSTSGIRKRRSAGAFSAGNSLNY